VLLESRTRTKACQRRRRNATTIGGHHGRWRMDDCDWARSVGGADACASERPTIVGTTNGTRSLNVLRAGEPARCPSAAPADTRDRLCVAEVLDQDRPSTSSP
jgi:hypothetical protein